MTVAQITELRDAAREAYLSATKAKSYSVNLGGTARNITRQDLDKLRTDFLYWENELTKAANGRQGIPMKFITPL